jgi:hypothetical protein
MGQAVECMLSLQAKTLSSIHHNDKNVRKYRIFVSLLLIPSMILLFFSVVLNRVYAIFPSL